MTFLENLDYVHWLTLGLVLMVVEVTIAGTSYLMWTGFAALFTGLLTLLLPPVMVWQLQLVVFGIASVGSVLLWKRYVKERPEPDAPLLNQRGVEHVGRVVALDEGIVGGRGRVRIDDTLWMVTGPDAPAGSRVRLLTLDGNIYRVERAD